MAKRKTSANGTAKDLPDNMKLNVIREVLFNDMTSRRKIIQDAMDPRRNIDDECGYPDTQSITSRDYRELYDRLGIATRIVELMPTESWLIPPTVFETDDLEQTTEFETAWEDLGKSLRGDSWFEDEEGNPIWEYLLRADILSGIGSYGVLLLGIDDGLELREPANLTNKPKDENKPNDKEGITGNAGGRKLIFLRAFDEVLAQITQYETDVTNPRFGQPTMYNLSFADPTGLAEQAVTGVNLTTQSVHWTRVIHLADNLNSSEVLGVPRMRPNYNRLMDLRKLYGGSGEMYWKGAFPGLSIETNPEFGSDIEVDTTGVKSQIEDYMNGLQRYLTMIGLTAKSLAPQVVDPTPQIDTQLEAICIQMECPKRVFAGSERGELASSQDSKAWNNRVKGRQSSYVTPRVVVPFVDRLIQLGVLPAPSRYNCVWPDLDALSEEEQATVALNRTEALSKYVQGGVESVIPPMEYLTSVLGVPDDEAKAMLEAAMSHMEDVKAEEMEEHDLERGEVVEDGEADFERQKELQRLSKKE